MADAASLCGFRTSFSDKPGRPRIGLRYADMSGRLTLYVSEHGIATTSGLTTMWLSICYMIAAMKKGRRRPGLNRAVTCHSAVHRLTDVSSGPYL